MQKLKFIFCIVVCFVFFFFSASFVFAIDFTPQIGVGNGFETGKAVSITGNSIANYIIAIYKYAITAIGIIATIVLMIGGVRWLVAGGSPEAVNDAKAWIKASLSGLVLMLCSYLLLSVINTNLTNFKPIDVREVEKINIYTGTDDQCAQKGGTAIIEAANIGKDAIKDCQYTCVANKQMSTQSSYYDDGSGKKKFCCICESAADKNGCQSPYQSSFCTTDDGYRGYCDSNMKCTYCVKSGEKCPVSGDKCSFVCCSGSFTNGVFSSTCN